MKEFNLNEYLKNPSQKVVTRDGRAVRIICVDFKSDFPIVALIYDEERQKENIECFFENGKYLFFDADDSPLDLFFTSTKREGWTNVYKDKDGGVYLSGLIFESEKEAKEIVNGNNYYVASVKIEWEE